LKVIEDHDEIQEVQSNDKEIMEVQKILNHRKTNNRNEYLVKWKNLSNKHNEWLDEKDFVTTEIISKY